MKHIAIFNNSGDVQTALNEETLVNPYVALVSGVLDYNSIQPYEPSYIGEWSDDGEGTYTFQILDSGPSNWGNETTIATANLVLEGASTDVDITIQYDVINSEWHMQIVPPEAEASNPVEYYFSPGTEDTWDTGVMTDAEDSDSTVRVAYDGVATFTFYSGSANNPLYLDTINPGYPVEEEEYDPGE